MRAYQSPCGAPLLARCRAFCAAARHARLDGSASRAAALAHWNAKPAPTAAADPAKAAPAAKAGKGMTFASGLMQNAVHSTRLTREEGVGATVADVKWDTCERMDFYIQYGVPSNWLIAEHARENSVSIQCSPPSTSSADGPTVHGIALNCFAYKQRVREPDNEKLLHVFLKRFNASVGNSLEVVSECVGAVPGQGDGAGPVANNVGFNVCEMLATRLQSAVAEITFTPAPGQPLARGLCRAFFNTNNRFHYVVVVAVPDSEFSVSQDLIIHTVMSVVESRVEAGAKQT